MGLKYSVIDNEDTLACAARNGIPREDLAERPCVNCGEPVLLLRRYSLLLMSGMLSVS